VDLDQQVYKKNIVMYKWEFQFNKGSKKMRRDILPFFIIRFFKNKNLDIFPKGVYHYAFYFGWWRWFFSLDMTKTLNK
jgi:hypothetical protein